MNTVAAPLIRPGDRAPACCGMTINRQFYSFEEQYGRPAVLVLAGTAAVARLSPVIKAFAARMDAFAARNADVLLLVDDDPRTLWSDSLHLVPIRTIDCGSFLARCGVGIDDTLLLVLDRNLRVCRRLQPFELFAPEGSADCPSSAAACLASLDELPLEAPADSQMPAPVIVLPNLFDRTLCRSLIEQFETSATVDGEVARIDAQGIVRSVVDHNKKYRRDLLIRPNSDLHQSVSALLLSRCAPEIAKAFQVNVSYLDRILVARYDEAGGWFRRHRDDAAENVAFRQFAISVNLNAEGYCGGHLLFPEYNDHRYSPPTGGGLIFSTSILHEASPITSGRRYVLLTFFHTAEAEHRRQDYLLRTGS